MSISTVPGFEPLSHSISIQRALDDETSTQSSRGECSLIVYCSWMGAAPKHIAKYTAGYRRLFPRATILLVQCSLAGMFFAPDLQHAADVVAAHMNADGGSGADTRGSGVVWAMASNGGATMALRLAALLQQRGVSPITVDALVLDCAPGLPDLASGARAVSLALPTSNPLARAAGYYVIFALLALWVAGEWALRGDNPISRMRRDLGARGPFPANTPRLYLYSKADKMVDWRGVRDHAGWARDEGCSDVREEMFESAPHCTLLNEDGERYWRAVKTVATGS